MNSEQTKFKAIVVGVSAGGLQALQYIFQPLPENFKLPIVVVQHRMDNSGDLLEKILNEKLNVLVKQADEKMKVEGGVVYIAPPGYHLMIEADQTFSLTREGRVNYSIPSIDVLFETASDCYRNELIGILLTGANGDGAFGLLKISRKGGYTIVQDPNEALYATMPQAALDLGVPSKVLKLDEIQKFLLSLTASNYVR
jgi:two-component system, chemotaxis family, protein-glutamate methylesterase/glutaminase